jgi:Tol biopolymer transport system component
VINQTLSHFKISAKLGEGGMGAVYRAEDSKLGREVAIKVLPAAVAQDPERLARFEREARLLASLNHANIAAIYQVEQDGETHFLVMELVEGDDLKERLARGPLALDDALSTGFQIAKALEAAHEKGIVHRDLKPANVKVTPEGRVKVLDFGLAKALDQTVSSESRSSPSTGADGPLNLSMSPTLTADMTEAGVILGTTAYMSPEQVRGAPVDRRADVWAFGVLLWEMLTARRLFDGDTVTDVIASVVTKDPDLELLPAATPPEVERLLARCLRKDPSRRLPDIGTARLVLQDLLTDTAPEVRSPEMGADQIAADEAGRRGRRRWLWATAVLVAAGVALGALLSRLSQEPDPAQPQAVRFATAAPEGWSFDSRDHEPVPSPAGDRVVFIAWGPGQGGDNEPMLWLRSLGSLTALPLGGTEGVNPFGPLAWSPDGESILFGSGPELNVLDLANGEVRNLTRMPAIERASWNDSGTIIIKAGDRNPLLYSIPASGGRASPLTSLDPSRLESGHYFPQFLPDGNRFLFMVLSGEPENTGTYLASLENPAQRQKVVAENEWNRREYAAGHLLFLDQGTLVAQPFDLEAGQPTGSPVVLAPSVAANPNLPGLGRFSASMGTTLSYLPGSGGAGLQLLWRDRTGEITEIVGEARDYGQISLSPDGRKLGLEIRDEEGQFDLWTMDVARGVTSRVTATLEDERDPVWSPDSRSLAYIKRGSEGASLCRKGLRPSDSETVIKESTEEYIPESWSADGKTLIVVQRTLDDRQSIWAISEGDDPRPFLTPGFRVDEPQISPDGRWLAYVSPESGQDEVYLEPFGREGERARVSLKGGGQPKWRADSRELFFVTLENVLMAVDVGDDTGRTEVGLPQELFKIEWIVGPGYDDYAVTADGQRFLVKAPVELVDPRLHIVANWPALLD